MGPAWFSVCSARSALQPIASASFLARVGPGLKEIQLLPAGEFRAIDGRPAEVQAWKLDRATAERLIAEFNAKKNDLVIDYEHQTLHAEDNGKPAPAAGWIKALEWREGKGL